MKPILFMILNLIIYSTFAQTLSLPARPADSYNGSQFVSVITSLDLYTREDSILAQVLKGNVPDFQRNLIPITTTATINSTSYTLTYYVLPDYLAIGCDTNYFLCPMTPVLAQKICNSTNCIMPTRLMVNQIWTAATVKLAPSTIEPSAEMVTVPVFNQHNTTVWGQRSAVLASHPLGELVGGNKKDVVISNLIYTSASPLRVVIYGWHQLNGTPIQPLYAGHENFYADYSHGIRLVQKNATLNGVSTTLPSILANSSLYSLISDEGVISNATYPISAVTVDIPVSFAWAAESASSIRLITANDPLILSYKVEASTDGITFNAPITISASNPVIDGLTENTVYFLKIAAVTSDGESDYSEVLAAVPHSGGNNIVIVNGFDRNSTGNTYDFIKQHGTAFMNNNRSFNSATNEAVVNDLINLQEYTIADYILGEESTANETFSNAEQAVIKSFLENGGKLFISGAEIAWDLDYKGTTSDKDFYNNYLKAQYVSDAPNNQTATYYQVSALTENIFDGTGDLYFDNGTHGTYNVDYPDVINPVNGSFACMYYTGFATQYAAIAYDGMFPNGSIPGKLINMGFPFETIYPETSRNLLMEKILNFFDTSLNSFTQELSADNIQIYPNPFNSEVILKTEFNESETFNICLTNMSGIKVIDKNISGITGINYFTLNTENLDAGIYIYSVQTKNSIFTGKIIKY